MITFPRTGSPDRTGPQWREFPGPSEGLSPVPWQKEGCRLADLRSQAPEYFSGREDFGVLLKLLDSAERLHIQAHPNDAFVQKRLAGTFGKTECWYVLSTRETDASVLLGCQHSPQPEEWGAPDPGAGYSGPAGLF